MLNAHPFKKDTLFFGGIASLQTSVPSFSFEFLIPEWIMTEVN